MTSALARWFCWVQERCFSPEISSPTAATPLLPCAVHCTIRVPIPGLLRVRCCKPSAALQRCFRTERCCPWERATPSYTRPDRSLVGHSEPRPRFFSTLAVLTENEGDCISELQRDAGAER